MQGGGGGNQCSVLKAIIMMIRDMKIALCTYQNGENEEVNKNQCQGGCWRQGICEDLLGAVQYLVKEEGCPATALIHDSSRCIVISKHEDTHTILLIIKKSLIPL